MLATENTVRRLGLNRVEEPVVPPRLELVTTSGCTALDWRPRQHSQVRRAELIAELTDWRGEMLAKVREIIYQADPEIIEEWKWMGSPVWFHDGIIAVGNAHKDKVKLTLSHGASLSDPNKLFNADLKGNTRRAIDFFEGDKINGRAPAP